MSLVLTRRRSPDARSGRTDRSSSLVDTPSNPVPDGAVCDFVETSDGVRLRFARFPAGLRPSKGTVVLVQGRSEYIEKYYETIRDMQERGFGVVAFDFRGQGRSDRLLTDRWRGHVGTFHDYVRDLDTIMRDVALPDCRAPFHLLGHSMGGLVALIAGARVTGRFSRMVLSAPLLAYGDALPISQAKIEFATGALTWLGLPFLRSGTERLPIERDFAGNVLTSDAARYGRNQATVRAAPDLTLAAPTVGWLHASCRAMNEAWQPETMARHRTPTLIVSAGADRLVDPRAVGEYGQRLRSGVHLDVAGARHEILQERDELREPFLAAFDAFVPGADHL